MVGGIYAPKGQMRDARVPKLVGSRTWTRCSVSTVQQWLHQMLD